MECACGGRANETKMRIMKNILISIILLFSHQVYCCDCKELSPLDSLRVISYNHSDIVFLGELIDFDTSDFFYSFNIIELFKGETKSKFITGKYFDSCSQLPTEKCEWIVYANIKDNNIIDINSCLASRSKLRPICINCYDPPQPLMPNTTEYEKGKLKELERIFWETAKNDWIKEIELLRNRKIK